MDTIKTRYCTECHEYTLHDATTDDDRDPSGFLQRTIFGILTAGMSEALRNNIWKCEKCGKETSR